MSKLLRADNENAKGSSCGIIVEALQSSARDDVLLRDIDVQLLSARDIIELGVSPSNEKSGRKEKIVAEIKQLKKQQKITQIKPKLYNLKE